MPPINTQGSRSGLITAVVIFAVLFVTAVIFAIYFDVQLKASSADFTNYKKQYNGVVSESDLTTPQFAELQTLKNSSDKSMNAVDVFDLAVKQRNALAAAITGTHGDYTAAKNAAQAALATADKLKTSHVNVPANSLAGTVTALVDAVKSDQSQISDLTQQLSTAKDNLASTSKAIAAANASRDQNLEQVHAQSAAELQKVNSQFAQNKQVIQQLQQDQASAAKTAQAAAQKTQVAMAGHEREIKTLTEANGSLRAKLGNHRPDVTNPTIQQADGKIVRVPGSGVCYINLGQGDQVSPGMTFEVYSAAKGIPPLPSSDINNDTLPVGEASIEITHVDATSSECRIVKTAPGVIISEGDLIANLVYDPNVQYNFFVYGEFDLANNNRPNTADAAVIKRLITQWGGKVGSKENVNTDFVVIGTEPALPNFTREELDQPLNADKLAKAQAALDKYQAVVQTARDLHIPILNQNRFLYYVGYYDQANR